MIPSRQYCPGCGSSNNYIHDKGWTFLIRWITGDSRIVCNDCKLTWRRRHPNQFSKLKNRKRSIKNPNAEYVVFPWTSIIIDRDESAIDKLLSLWEEQGNLHICLDLKGVNQLAGEERASLVKIARKLKTISGSLLVTNLESVLENEFRKLNLSYLIFLNQKIKKG